MSEPTYSVEPTSGGFCVMTGNHVVVTKTTRDRTLAESWCTSLRRAAQVETDRKRKAHGA